MRKPIRWEQTWMAMSHLMSGRSKDQSFQAGAVLIAPDGKSILAGAYNGPPPTINDDFDRSDRTLRHYLTNHAESNCLWFACAAHGRQALVGSVLYVNGRPCSQCAKEVARAGLGGVVWDDTNPSQPKMVDDVEWAKTQDILHRAGVELIPYSSLLEDG